MYNQSLFHWKLAKSHTWHKLCLGTIFIQQDKLLVCFKSSVECLPLGNCSLQNGWIRCGTLMGRRLPRIVFRSYSSKRFNPMLIVTSMFWSFLEAFFCAELRPWLPLSWLGLWQAFKRHCFPFRGLDWPSKRGRRVTGVTLGLTVPTWGPFFDWLLLQLQQNLAPFLTFLAQALQNLRRKHMCLINILSWQMRCHFAKEIIEKYQH